MKRKFLSLVMMFFSLSLFAGETEIASALGENGKYFYCAKYNDVYRISCKNNKVYYDGYDVRNGTLRSGSAWSDTLDPTRFEIKDNEVISIVYRDTKLVLTNIKNPSQIIPFLNEAAFQKIRKVCGKYRDDVHKQSIFLSETDGKFYLNINKDDGTKIEDILENVYNRGATGKEYFLFFGDSGIYLGNRKEEQELEIDYDYEFCFPLPYEKISYFQRPEKITASSTLIEKNKAKDFYCAQNLFDGSWKSWVEGIDGNGIGESISFEFEKPVSIANMYIRNGYGELKYYFANNRVKELAIYINDKFHRNYKLNDFWNFQELRIDAVNVQKIKLEIKSVYTGSKYADTCISEIYFQRDAYVSDSEKPVFAADDFTNEILSNFPLKNEAHKKELFYTQDGIPFMLYFSNPPSVRDPYCFYDVDFYVYDIKKKSWNKDNSSNIFAAIKSASDKAKADKYPMIFSTRNGFKLEILGNSHNEVEFVYNGTKFAEPAKIDVYTK